MYLLYISESTPQSHLLSNYVNVHIQKLFVDRYFQEMPEWIKQNKRFVNFPNIRKKSDKDTIEHVDIDTSRFSVIMTKFQ